MYQRICASCQADHELDSVGAVPWGVDPDGQIVYARLDPGERPLLFTAADLTAAQQLTHPQPEPNPLQRYVCPRCGYAHTQNPSARWEQTLQSFAGVMLLVAGGLFAGAMGWSIWGWVATMGVLWVLIWGTEQTRSAVEDWLDPPEPTR